VRVESFSYRRGYPRDATGHGGGFVFDCRALPNPGRRPEFADATGRDATVRVWLEEEPAVEAFYEHVRALVGAQVATYAERGFTDLTVAFGCTGGQHRSVYFAERLARDLRAETGPVEVRLHHREEPYWPEEPGRHAEPRRDRVSDRGT
jgi:RNase adaptor protein for sRNA GlmZ degradation